jgi:hypothetical protein
LEIFRLIRLFIQPLREVLREHFAAVCKTGVDCNSYNSRAVGGVVKLTNSVGRRGCEQNFEALAAAGCVTQTFVNSAFMEFHQDFALENRRRFLTLAQWLHTIPNESKSGFGLRTRNPAVALRKRWQVQRDRRLA